MYMYISKGNVKKVYKRHKHENKKKKCYQKVYSDIKSN